jgi:hypothetical protein
VNDAPAPERDELAILRLVNLVVFSIGHGQLHFDRTNAGPDKVKRGPGLRSSWLVGAAAPAGLLYLPLPVAHLLQPLDHFRKFSRARAVITDVV